MQGHGWQSYKKVTVPNGGTATVSLPASRPVLDKFTVWASSGARQLSNMTFQVRINGKNFGTAVSVVAALAADLVLVMNGASRDQALIPYVPATLSLNADPTQAPDTFNLDVLLTNAGANPEAVTVLFAGIGRE